MVCIGRQQEKVFGKGGRRRKRVVVDVSDDEGDEMPSEWARSPVELNAASTALAIKWLRTARNRISKAKMGEEATTRRRKPGKGKRK